MTILFTDIVGHTEMIMPRDLWLRMVKVGVSIERIT